MKRRLYAGTGWKMNNSAAQTRAYARELLPKLTALPLDGVELFVLPPFTSLHAAAEAFAGSPVAIGGQNMHWDEAGAWTGEVSAAMLVEAGCRFVELGHAERLAHFGETYEAVRRKAKAALAAGLAPIICIGESAEERSRAGAVIAAQLETALADVSADDLGKVVLAYEPRWAIGAAAAAPLEYVAAGHGLMRERVGALFGAAASATPILYGGSVDAMNGPTLIALADVDGLFVGRAAWTASGFAEIVRIVAEAKRLKEAA